MSLGKFLMAAKNIAIIDIGSNAVRLVIYNGLSAAPIKIHTDRVICNLGIDLATTGLLNKTSCLKAIKTIGRFSQLLKLMKIKNIKAVATAAIRDAKNSKEFIKNIKKDFGLKIEIIDGDEEARLSAIGVIANGLGSNGIIGDYGGGSLELIFVKNGNLKHKVSLPLGSHRLLTQKTREERIEIIDKALEKIDLLKDYMGQDITALGGSWRAMAKVHMYVVDYPLKVLDHYKVSGAQAAEFANLIATQSKKDIEKTVGMPKKRVKEISVAALVLSRLFKIIEPKNLLFSATGLREALVFEQLSFEEKQEDSLISGCKIFALKHSRNEGLDGFKELINWLKPLFENKGEEIQRLIKASCFLTDISLFEHEDYQAEHAFNRILLMPFYNLSHEGRAFLALSQYVRYKGYLRRSERALYLTEATRAAHLILDKDTIDRAIILGLAQYMGYSLTGGALSLLKDSKLELDTKHLTLKLYSKSGAFNADTIDDVLARISQILGKSVLVET